MGRTSSRLAADEAAGTTRTGSPRSPWHRLGGRSPRRGSDQRVPWPAAAPWSELTENEVCGQYRRCARSCLKPIGKYTSIGGQAVIEGVMMRSPHFIAIAVRKASQKIQIQFKTYQGWSHQFPFLKKPVLRGIVALLES